MRVLLLLLVILPAAAMAQINRSATELARESVQTYLTTKIFKDQAYKSVSYGELKPVVDKKRSDIAWKIQHRFEIDEVVINDDKTLVHKPYKFDFYFDKKMTIIAAYSSYLQD